MTRATRLFIATLTMASGLAPAWVWAQGLSEADRYTYGPRMMWWN